jgi:FkbM family methyltransferase
MRVSFPYFRLIRRPADVISYGLLRFLSSPRLISLKAVRTALEKWFPYVSLRPPILAGKQILIATADRSQILVFNEIFVDKVYDLTRVPFVPDQIVDCGAHVGMFSVLGYRFFPSAKFILFEPNPNNVTMLRENIKRNRLNFEIVNAAVSNEDGEVRFIPETSFGGYISDDQRPVSKSIQVKAVNLGDVIRRLHAASLLVKLDIEGAEEKALPASVPYLPQRTAIFMETHSANLSNTAELLRASGFSVFCTRPRGEYGDWFAIRE